MLIFLFFVQHIEIFLTFVFYYFAASQTSEFKNSMGRVSKFGAAFKASKQTEIDKYGGESDRAKNKVEENAYSKYENMGRNKENNDENENDDDDDKGEDEEQAASRLFISSLLVHGNYKLSSSSCYSPTRFS